MKKYLLSLSFAVCTAFTLSAQDAPKEPAAGERRPNRNPEQRLKAMTESLNLTAEQQEKVKKIMEEGRAEMQALRDGPEEGRREKSRAAMQAQRDKINAVLTPEQQEKYKAAAENQRRNRGEGDRPAGDKPAGEKPAADKPAAEKAK